MGWKLSFATLSVPNLGAIRPHRPVDLARSLRRSFPDCRSIFGEVWVEPCN